MKKLCKIYKLATEDELFEKITSTFKHKITQWDYFVNWEKVLKNINSIEMELNLLNTLVGKTDTFDSSAFQLLKKYPTVIKAFPQLIALRENSVDILIDSKNFLYSTYSFKLKKGQELSDDKCKDLIYFMHHIGLAQLLKDKTVKNLVDYVLGVEVGLDSNGRKNRGGTLMESLVKEFVQELCVASNNALDFMEQATKSKIKQKWGIDIEVDKSSRRIDFAINNKGQIYFIECNFYGGGGSKLKSTATEYIEMNRYWNAQGIKFIWITDGFGWQSTLHPLREYFNRAEYLLNLDMLKEGVLKKIIFD